METLFDLIPSELIIIILSYSDKDSIDKLSTINRLDKLLNERSTWIFILISEYKYEYQILKDINEDSIENMKDLYYKLKEGGIYYESNFQDHMKIKNISSSYLVKILLYNNYPRIYNRLLQLINSESYISLLERLQYLDIYGGIYEYVQTGIIPVDSIEPLASLSLGMPYLWIYINNDKINLNKNLVVLSQLFSIQDYFRRYHLDEKVYNTFLYNLLYNRLPDRTIRNVARGYIENYEDETPIEIRDRLYSVVQLKI